MIDDDAVSGSEPQRYLATGFRRYTAGHDAAVIYLLAARSAHVLPADIVAVLENCRVPRTLREHASLAVNRPLNAAGNETVFDLLSELVRAGFLRPERLNAFCASSPAEVAPEISTVGFVTAERPECLERGLVSLSTALSAAGRRPDLVVFDDTRRPEARLKNEQILRRLKKVTISDVFYAGHDQKQRFARMLIEAGHSARVVYFALFGHPLCKPTIGANRNALLLHSGGEFAFAADDDVVFELAAPPATRSDVCLSMATSPGQLWFFPNRQAALESAVRVDTDLLAEHRLLLGKTVSAAVAGSGGLSEPENGAPSAKLLACAESNTGRVLAVQTGLLGDSGFGSPSGLLTAHGATRARLVASEASYRTAATSREVLHSVTAPTITEGGFCMGYALSLDNREGLPPFFPVQRNTDGVFGRTLRLVNPTGFIGHIPCAILHAPPETRAYCADAIWRDSERHETSDLMIRLLRGICG